MAFQYSEIQCICDDPHSIVIFLERALWWGTCNLHNYKYCNFTISDISCSTIPASTGISTSTGLSTATDYTTTTVPATTSYSDYEDVTETSNNGKKGKPSIMIDLSEIWRLTLWYCGKNAPFVNLIPSRFKVLSIWTPSGVCSKFLL